MMWARLSESTQPGLFPRTRGPMHFGALVILVALTALGSGVAQTPAPGGAAWERDLWIRFSNDGTLFGQGALFEKTSGVPSVVRDTRGLLLAAFQWFPADDPAHWDRVAVKVSADAGSTWSTPQPIQVAGLPENFQRPFDPTLAVLDDGRIRIYFSSNSTGKLTLDAGVATYSGISHDGIHYTFEPEMRFGVSGKPVIDPAVVKLGDAWHYTAPAGRPQDGAYHATSPDGLNFTRLADIPSVDGVNWTGNLLTYQDGVRFYGGSERGIWWAFSQDGAAWTRPSYLGFSGGDPTLAPTGDGRFIIVYVGEPAGAVSPTALYLPRMVQTAAQSTGLALVNPSAQPVQLILTALQDTGAMFSGAGITNPAVRTLDPNSQFAAVASEIFGAGMQANNGWIRVNSTYSGVKGLFLLFDPALNLLDGADINSRIMQNFVLPEVRNAEISLVNPGSQPAVATLQLMSDSGLPAATTTATIAPGGRWTATSSAAFPPAVVAGGGYLQVNSTAPLSGLETLGTTEAFKCALNAFELIGAQVLYSPQYAEGGGWHTVVTLINMESRPTSVRVELSSDSGSSVGNAINLTLPARARIVVPAPFAAPVGPPAGMVQGYLRVSSDTSRLTGYVQFGDPGESRYQTALPLVSQGQTAAMFAHVASNDTYFTGVAILNANAAPADVTISVYDPAGTLLGTRMLNLPPTARTVKLLTELLPGLPALSRGYFRISAAQPVFSYAVFGTHTLSAISAIPAQ